MEFPNVKTVIEQYNDNKKKCIEWLKAFYKDKDSIPSDKIIRKKVDRLLAKNKSLVKLKGKQSSTIRDEFLNTIFQLPMKKTPASSQSESDIKPSVFESDCSKLTIQQLSKELDDTKAELNKVSEIKEKTIYKDLKRKNIDLAKQNQSLCIEVKSNSKRAKYDITKK